jgi:two-component system, OmpR family, phosphate regulon sensor histidine kinase PhoR
MKRAMKTDRQVLLAITTFTILGLLVLIQVGWIFRAANLEKQNFNHRVAMAMKGARDEIGRRAPRCNDMTAFLCGRGCAADVHRKKSAEIDSILHANLSINNILLPYTFVITDSILPQSKGKLFTAPCYLQNLNGLLDLNGIQIRIQFPSRNQFLMAQMSGLLGLSILFILFIMLSFFLTFRMFRKERMLLVHTTDFINNMVHEFQTPIANMRFAANLIKKQKTDGNREKTDEYTGVILEETQRLQNHVESILRVANNGNSTAEKETIQVQEIIDHVISTLRYRLDDSHATLQFIPAAGNHEIEGERGPFSLIISNLIDNALKYVKQKPHIHIGTHNHGNNLIITIADNGIGISKENQTRIFDKFYRVSTGDVHNVKGFGLGLTYVKKVTLQFGGTVSVESEPAKGSTFTLSFPTAKK